jgi:uncharacterized protein
VSERLPSRQRAIELLRRSGCPLRIVQHCRTVSKLAVHIAKILQKKGYKVDVELVEIGALLHDIGRSETHSVDHAIAGARIAENYALPRSVVRIIERHVGAGIPQNEAEKLGWPKKSYLPETLEERIVNYADKLVEGTHRVSIERTIADFSRKMGKTHPGIERLKTLDKEFRSMLGESQCKP